LPHLARQADDGALGPPRPGRRNRQREREAASVSRGAPRPREGIKLFTLLPVEALDRLALKNKLAEIGRAP
jgi:hypothetical protein